MDSDHTSDNASAPTATPSIMLRQPRKGKNQTFGNAALKTVDEPAPSPKKARHAVADVVPLMAARVHAAPEGDVFPAPFPVTFRCIDGDKFEIVRLGPNNTCSVSCIEDVETTVALYVREHGDRFEALKVLRTSDVLYKVAKTWHKTFRTLAGIPLPAPVAFLSDPHLAFVRLPWDPVTGATLEDCPHFAAFLERTHNADSLCAWVGALFHPRADRSQAVWLWGGGDTGKSCFVDVLSELFGTACGSLKGHVFTSPHGTAELLNLRLGVLAEISPAIVQSDSFKSLTGDNKMNVNQKYEKAYTATVSVMFAAISNDPPQVGSDIASQRRIIDCKVTPFEGERIERDEHIARLRAELPQFVGYCMAVYAPMAGKRIPTNKEQLLEIAADTDADLYTFVDTYLLIGPQNRCKPQDILAITANRREFNSPKQRNRLMAFLRVRMGVKDFRPWDKEAGAAGPRMLMGVSLRAAGKGTLPD